MGLGRGLIGKYRYENCISDFKHAESDPWKQVQTEMLVKILVKHRLLVYINTYIACSIT